MLVNVLQAGPLLRSPVVSGLTTQTVYENENRCCDSLLCTTPSSCLSLDSPALGIGLMSGMQSVLNKAFFTYYYLCRFLFLMPMVDYMSLVSWVLFS